MKHSCRYLLISGIVYTLGIWGFSYYYFDSQAKKMEVLFDQAHEALFFGRDESRYVLKAAPFVAKGFYYNNWKSAGICDGISAYYKRFNLLDQALFWNYMEEKIIKKSDSEQILFFTYTDLSELYFDINNIGKAKFYLLEAEKYLKKYQHTKVPEPHYQDTKIGEFYYLYGKILFREAQYSDSMEMFQKSLIYMKKDDDTNEVQTAWIGSITFNIAKCYFSLKDYQNSETALYEAINYFSKTKNYLYYLLKCHLFLCKIFVQNNNIEDARTYLDSIINSEHYNILDIDDYKEIEILKEKLYK